MKWVVLISKFWKLRFSYCSSKVEFPYFLSFRSEEVLAELQFSFICFLVGQHYDSFEHWKHLLKLFCSADEALVKYADMYLTLITDMHFQVRPKKYSVSIWLFNSRMFIFVFRSAKFPTISLWTLCPPTISWWVSWRNSSSPLSLTRPSTRGSRAGPSNGKITWARSSAGILTTILMKTRLWLLTWRATGIDSNLAVVWFLTLLMKRINNDPFYYSTRAGRIWLWGRSF